MRYHKTKSGKKIALSDMTDSHLMNCISLWERKIEEGIIVQLTLRRFDMPDDIGAAFTPPTKKVRGQEAADEIGVKKYVVEAKQRGLIDDRYPIMEYVDIE